MEAVESGVADKIVKAAVIRAEVQQLAATCQAITCTMALIDAMEVCTELPGPFYRTSCWEW